jgi:2-oxoglutarate dehydrogenase E2 component (dihydrolipoamide succinyltransferase)
VQAQATQAILTTFNEVDMAPVMELRKRYKDKFEKEHGVKLGFMSFFVKAAVEALKKYPVVNASVDGTDIVYHGYFDIGVAVGPPRPDGADAARRRPDELRRHREEDRRLRRKKARDGKRSRSRT